MERFKYIVPGVAGLLLTMPQHAAASSDDKRPNIIHIMSDDHSYQTISAYGHPISQIARTPNIDRLADEGMLFRRAYVENSLSTPSRACLMTGLYSHQNGQRRLGAGIDTSKVFFSELLRAAGYNTAVIGKWHMQCEPKGFDSYCVLRGQGPYYNPGFKTEKSEGRYIVEEGYTTDLITDHALEFLKNADRDRPFCLLVHHKAPHRNWMPASKYVNLYDDEEFPCPTTLSDDYSSRGTAASSQKMKIFDDMKMLYDLKVCESEKDREIFGNIPDGDRELLVEAYEEQNREALAGGLSGKDLLEWKYQRYLKDYLRCIKSVDDGVGRILDYLEESGLAENTVVVYTSDQGFYMGEHGWFDKRFMYEESFRTPLIIRYPGVIAPGSESTELVQNIDYAPTYLDLAGLKKEKDMVGCSLVPLFDHTAAVKWRDCIYYHYYDYPAVHMVRRHDGIFDGRFKLIHFYGEGVDGDSDVGYDELYDLLSDPMELNNIYGVPGYEKITSELQKKLDEHRKKYGVDEF